MIAEFRLPVRPFPESASFLTVAVPFLMIRRKRFRCLMICLGHNSLEFPDSSCHRDVLSIWRKIFDPRFELLARASATACCLVFRRPRIKGSKALHPSKEDY